MAEIDSMEWAPKSWVPDDDSDKKEEFIPKSFIADAPKKDVISVAPPANHAENPDVDRLLAEARGTLGRADEFDKSVSGKIEKEKSSSPTIKSRFSNIIKKATEPLTDAPSRFANAVAEASRTSPEPHEETMTGQGGISDFIARTRAQGRGFGEGAIQGIGNAISGFSSPVNIAALLASGGASAAGKAGLSGLETGLSAAAKASMLPVVASGGQKLVSPDSSMQDRALALTEIASGLVGMIHSPGGVHEELPIRRGIEEIAAPSLESAAKELPIRPPVRSLEEIRPGTSASEKWWQDYGDKINWKELPREGEELPPLHEGAQSPNDNGPGSNWIKERLEETNNFFGRMPSTEEEIAARINQESLAARPSEETPITATHIGTQPDEVGNPQHLYNIEGGPEHGTTVTEQGLKDRGLEVPPVDESKVGKSGAQLREEALAARAAQNTEKPVFENPFKKTEELQAAEEAPKSFTPNEELVKPEDTQSIASDNAPKSFQADEVPSEVPKKIVAQARMFRGAHEPISIGFTDAESREIFGAGQGSFKGGMAKSGVFQRMNQNAENVAKNYGLDPKEAATHIRDYNAEVRRLGSAANKEGGKITAPSFKEFLESKKTPDEVTEMQGGLGGIKPSSRLLEPNKGPYGAALDKLFSSMGKMSENRVQQDILNKAERGKRFAAFKSVDEVGVKGASQSLSKLKGEYEKVDIEKLKMTQPQVDSLFTAVKRAKITEGEKARGYTALFKILNGDGVPQRNELALLNEVFGNNFASKITEMHGGLGAVGMNIAKTANTMKAMKSSIDLSAPLRQGIGLVHRPEYREAFGNMFKYFGDKEFFDYSMREIQNDPLYIHSRESGLFLAKPDSITSGEEAFMSNYLHDLPKFAKMPFEASERAYTGFLNDLRFKTYKNLIKNAEASGLDVENSSIAKNISNYINVSTGRGSLGKLEKIGPELNNVLWSPKLLSSRLTVLNPKYYKDLDPFTRKEAIKSLLAIAASGSTVLGLGKLAGAKISTSPDSADFGKARFGNNVIDPWAGFQQPVVAAMRFISGTANGHSQSRTTTGENFFANKLSPMGSFIYELASALKFNGKTAPGDLTTLTPPQHRGFISRYGQQKYMTTEIRNSFIPMFTDDMTKLLKSDTGFAEQVGLDTYSLFGGGVQNYPEAEKKKLQFRKPSLK